MARKRMLKPKDERLLTTLGQLALGTTDQLNRVHYAKGNFTSTSTYLLELLRLGYVDVVYYKTHPIGRAKNVYFLATKGHRFLTRMKLVDDEELIRPSDNQLQEDGPLAHALQANELIVKALELRRKFGHWQIRFLPEPRLRRHPLVKGDIKLIPDSWVQIIPEPEREASIVFELDRSSIPLQRLEERIRGYLIIDQSQEYFDLFGTLGMVVVWVIADGDVKRRDGLKRMTEEILGPNHPQADLFYFGAVDAKTSAEDVYFGNRWFQPFSDEPKPLLPLSWRIANG